MKLPQLPFILFLLSNLLAQYTFSQTAKLIGSGVMDGGTIYSVNIDGTNPKTLVDMRFGRNHGWYQPHLIEKGGLLYGMTTQGVSSRYGVIFSINPDGSNYNEIFQFSGTDGYQPSAGLIDVNGKFYGTTWSGGTDDGGVLFSINYDGTEYNILHEFDLTTENGINPIGELVEYNGALWGVTAGGGVFQGGTIFTIDLTDYNYNKIYDFDRDIAYTPSGALTIVDGDLWGLTREDPIDRTGTIYKLVLSDTSFSVVQSSLGGRNPLGDLLLENGYLWGTTARGGTGDNGLIFRIMKDGTGYEIVHEFETGRRPEAGLIKDGTKLWGLTTDLTISKGGGIFSLEIDASNFTINHYFDYNSKYDEGASPIGKLLLYNGMFFGLANEGGSGGNGVLFSLDKIESDFQVIHSFGEDDGHNPYGDLIKSGEKLFGVTRSGGKGLGLIYSLDLDGSNYSKIHQFDLSSHFPKDYLIAKDGKLFGSTGLGGAYNNGVIYSINTDGTNYTILHDILSYEVGATVTTLIGDKLYGTLLGDNYRGAIFKMDLDGSSFEKIFDFDGSNGDNIVGKYLEFGEKIWGVTRSGGQNGFGVVFRIDSNGNDFEIIHHFDGINGRNPSDGIIDFNGELWGTTNNGGSEAGGTIFKIDKEGVFHLIHNFTVDNGLWPESTLVKNGDVLYGVTRILGGGSGSLYKIDSESLELTKIIAFSSEFGGRPSSIPILIKNDQNITFDAIEPKSYGDDTFTISATSNSVNPITFSSSDESIISIVDDQATILGAGEVTLFATQLESENHHAGQSEQTITIGKAQLMATAHDYEMVYGADLPDLDIDYTGFVNGDTELDIIEPTTSTLASSHGDVGAYEVTLTGGSASNYNISLNPGTITITKALLEVIANDKLMTYGSEIPVLDISYDGFLNDDTQLDITIPSISTSASSVSNVGTYEIILQEGSANNYDLSLNTGTLTVTKANLGVTAEDKAMVYGSSVPILALSYSGFLNDDTKLDIQEPTITTLASSTSDVGDYEITLTGGSSINYNFLLNPGTLTITKALLEVTAHNYVMTYGTDIPELDINYDGFLNGDSDEDITVPSISTSASLTSDVGIYEITLQEGFASNYELNLNPGTLTITKANLEVTAEDKVMTYGSEVPSLDLSYSGFLNGDTEIDITKPTITTIANSTSDVGDYEVTLTGGLSNNYDLSLIPGTLTISKAILVATPNNKTITYGDDIPELDISYSGFLNDDTELDITKPLASTLASSGSDAGNYELTLTGGSATNYELVLNTGVLAIKKAPQEITFADPGTINSDQSEIQLNAESNSGLEVIFESSNENILIISGNIGSVLNAGIVEILAKQPGNNNYLEADPVSRILTIEQVLGLGSMLEFNVYPNPFDSYFIVASPVNNGKIEDFAIFNSEGVSIPYESIDQGTQLIIKPKILVSGLYLTQFKVDGKSYYKRLVIK